MNNYERNKLDLGELYREMPQGEPLPDVENAIRLAARKEVAESATHGRKKRRSYSWFIPATAVASITLLISVISLVSYHQQEPSVNKLPMHMMVRTRPPAVETLLAELDRQIELENMSEAAVVYQKYRSFYPQHSLPIELEQKLIAHKIIK